MYKNTQSKKSVVCIFVDNTNQIYKNTLQKNLQMHINPALLITYVSNVVTNTTHSKYVM